jgi:hypothetical protein
MLKISQNSVLPIKHPVFFQERSMDMSLAARLYMINIVIYLVNFVTHACQS